MPLDLVLQKGGPGGIYHINGDTELSNAELTTLLLESCDHGCDTVTSRYDLC